MKSIITPVKGTRDFYPEYMAFHDWLTDKMHKAAQLFGYQHWDSPVLEPFELYAAKSGDELVNQQSFVFEDRGGRKIVLRPELTPSLARLIAQKQQELPKPIKWYSVGPMWRYEQPQKGRSREFWQWNVDCLGSNSPYADAEVIAIAITFLTSLGLTKDDFVVKINDRKWFQENVVPTGISEKDTGKFFGIVDRIDKMTRQQIDVSLKDLGLSVSQIDTIHDKLTNDVDFGTLSRSDNFYIVQDTLTKQGLGDFIQADISIVRGLQYYTGIVFEVKDRAGQLRSIGGGGRYANLVEQVGGQPLTGVGFALGDMPIEELLRACNKYPTDLPAPAAILVTTFSAETAAASRDLAIRLRNGGIAVDAYIFDVASPTPLDKQIKYALAKGIPYLAIIGPDEAANQTVTVKTLAAQNQETLPQADLAEFLTHK